MSGDLKSTHIFEAGGHHELKYGWHFEGTSFDQDRYYSGALGDRGLARHYNPGTPVVWTFFTLQGNEQPYQFTSHPYDLLGADYKNDLQAHISNFISSFFLQDSYSPLPNLTINAGARYEMQKMYDNQNAEFLHLENYLSPRIGVVWDPTNDGRSKVFAHYGQYYETIPLSLAARYFGGEGILIQPIDPTSCKNPPDKWTGGPGEWRSCTPEMNTNYSIYNNGKNDPVQPHLKGQYHSEIVAGAQREVLEDLVLGIDYTHRWLGNVIEDGTAYDFNFVVANPGNVPNEAITAYQNQVTQYTALVAQRQTEVDNASDPGGQGHGPGGAGPGAKSARHRAVGAGQPQRTSGGAQARAHLRRAHAVRRQALLEEWLVRASYTYSRLIGNYEGLYQDTRTTSRPTAATPTTHPTWCSIRAARCPTTARTRAASTATTCSRSGAAASSSGSASRRVRACPQLHLELAGNGQIVTLLPRGSGGRTPPSPSSTASFVSPPADAQDRYRGVHRLVQPLQPAGHAAVDDNYTFDSAAPIVNGSPPISSTRRTPTAGRST